MTTLTQTHTQLKSPLAMLYHWEGSQPQHPYLHQPISGQWHVWTWGQFGEEVRRMAAAIQAKGYEPGSRIGILSRNCAHWMMADLAVMMSGHVSVPIYPNVKAATVEYILQHSEARMLFVGKLEQHDWNEMKTGIPAEVECISFGMYGLNGADYPAWNEVTKAHAPLEGSPERDLQDIMTIIYTSGTTGLPKGVVHRFISPVFAIEQFISFFNLTPADRFFSYLPLSHIAERMLITMGTLRTGGSIHFAQSLDTFTDNLKTCKPTVFLGVPRIWTKFQMGVLAKFPPSRLNLLLAIPGVGGFIRKKIKEALGLDHARVTLSGAAAMPVALLEWYYKLGILIYEVYGMTENSAYSHANVPGAFKFGTVGKTLPECETKITEEGEICLRCITNLVEYYKEPEKTAESLRDGWLHTGDKGVEDAQGFLRITGRVKDLFKTSKAKYVAPSPIEMKFASNDLIEQICVVGTNLPQPIALAVLSADARNRNRDEVSKIVQDTLFAVNATLEDHEVLEKVVLMKEEWTVENGILTPSLKIKRGAVDDKFMKYYEKWYAGGKGVIWE